MLKLDEYSRYANLYPAFITVIPIVLLNHFYINSDLSGFLHSLGKFQVLTEIPIPVLFIIVVMEANRFISKAIIEKLYFSDEQRMPTTDILMYKDKTLSHLFKEKVRTQILRDFGIRLFNAQQERTNEAESRRLVVDAIAQIRERMKGGRLILQYNKQYGFMRNTIGGSLLALLVSLVNIYVFSVYYPNPTALHLSEFFAVLYLIPILLSRYIMNTYGKYYATRLIQEYLFQSSK